MSASAAILRISVKPPACIRSGWTMRQPPFSRSSRYSKRDSRRSPVAIGVLRSRCSAAIAFAFSNGIGSSNQPGRNGCSASSSITAVRGDRNSLHSMKMSASGPAPSRAPSISAAALRISPAVVVAQALERERPALERGEAAAHRLARAVERLLRRVGALQPVARVAAQRVRNGPPSSRATGTPSRLPSRSHSAMSSADSAVWSTAPPRQRHA